MSIPWSDVGSVSAAALSAVAAVGAWRAAWRANTTARAVAQIEHERWHADLTPKFRITTERAEWGETATLRVQLVGPIPLQYLSSVAIRITSSDDQERTAHLAGGRTQEELDAQVWGPWRFSAGADGSDAHGHTVAPVSLPVGRGRPFSIEATRQPAWHEGQDVAARWRAQWEQEPLRLELKCTKDGIDPWTVPYEIGPPAGGW